jgi:hypothetical protein
MFGRFWLIPIVTGQFIDVLDIDPYICWLDPSGLIKISVDDNSGSTSNPITPRISIRFRIWHRLLNHIALRADALAGLSANSSKLHTKRS